MERIRRFFRTLSAPVASQFALPHGPGARIMAPLLNTANRRVNRAAVRALDIREGEHILDVGPGGGVGIRFAVTEVGGGQVTGVDPSVEMVRRARRAFRSEIAEGRVEVLEGRVERLPVADSTFDGCYTVNTIYFWPDVTAGLRGLLRALKPAGRLVIAMQPSARRSCCAFFGAVPPTPEALVALLEEAGYDDVDVRRPGPGIELVLARKPA